MNYLQENKNHIISQLPKLSSEEKEEVKRYFNSHANLENQVDWDKSNWDNLTFEYFIQNFINKQSKRAKKKAVKLSGINGLTEGEDYLLVYQGEYTKENGDTGSIEGYIPLSWESSRVIASKDVGSDKVEGEWCTAYQKNSEYWDEYNKNGFLIYFVNYHNRGFSNKESDWGKEAALFNIERIGDLKEDIFLYKGYKQSFDKKDYSPENSLYSIITHNKILGEVSTRFSSLKEVYPQNNQTDIGEFACNKLQSSKVGITRQTPIFPKIASTIDLQKYTNTIFVSGGVSSDNIFINPRNSEEKEFFDSDMSPSYDFELIIAVLPHEKLGTGLYLQEKFYGAGIRQNIIQNFNKDVLLQYVKSFPNENIFYGIEDLHQHIDVLVESKISYILAPSPLEKEFLEYIHSCVPMNINSELSIADGGYKYYIWYDATDENFNESILVNEIIPFIKYPGRPRKARG